MKNLSRFLVATLVPALIVTIFAVSAVAAGGNAGKETICHWASHKFVKINVSMNAEPAHLRHGDVLPDEYGDCSSDESQAADGQGDSGESEGVDSEGADAGGSNHGNSGHSSEGDKAKHN